MPIKVLHIEDNPGDALLLRELLLGYAQTDAPQFELTCEDRLSSGCAKLSAVPFDVVLLDLSLPDSSGMETFKRLHDKFPHVPIIVLSGLDDTAAAMQTVHAGAQDYFCKDELNSRELTRAMRYAIERHRTDEALENERRMLRALIDSLPDQIYVKDRKSRFIACNPAVAQIHRLNGPADLMGKTDFDLFPKNLADEYFLEESGVIAGKPRVNREERIIDNQGCVRWLLTTKVPMYTSSGEIVGLVGINRDITERKFAEDKLVKAMTDMKRAQEDLKAAQLQVIQSEKLETLGRLAAGVAHEVKNPLSVAVMGLDYLKNMLGTDHAAAPVIRDIYDSIKRADLVVGGLLDYSRPRTLILKNDSLNEIVRQALKLVKHEITGKRIVVIEQVEKNMPALRMDSDKIKQVFINLLVNAAHATPDQGTITVRTFSGSAGRLRSEDAEFHAQKFADAEAVIGAHVIDSGCGIKPEFLEKVFEPFFTTKPAGQGTGLGLPVVKQIVEMHGGIFELRNRNAGGACASVVLPAATRERETGVVKEPELEAKI